MQLEVTSQLDDIQACFPNFPVKCIFDVGANIGQSVDIFHSKYPEAHIHCFEPTPASFKQLSNRFHANPLVRTNNLGVSDCECEVSFTSSGTSTMNRICRTGRGNMTVKMIDLDSYCRSHKITQIDYLKIDTEGNELNVILGMSEIMPAIGFIETEASLNPHNKYHQSFFDIYQRLTNSGFYLFGIYEQVREWSGGGIPIMRRANPVFVNAKLINPIPPGVITS